MKKISMLFLSLLVIVLVTGCGDVEDKEQKLVCTTTENEEGMSIEQVISMTYKNEKLNHMAMEINTTITDSTIQDNWEDFKKSMDENNQEFNKDGVSLDVVVDNEHYKYNTIWNIDVTNASEEVLKEYGFEDIKNDNSTIEENKKLAEKDGATCEIQNIK